MSDTTKLARAVLGLTEAVKTLDDKLGQLEKRLQTLEAKFSETSRQAEAVAAAQRSWRPLLRAQGDLLLASEAGQTCRVPLSVCRALAAGRALDLDVRDAGDDVQLVDHAGRLVAELPRGALLALPRIMASPEAGKLVSPRSSTTTLEVASRSCSRVGVATGRADRRETPELRAVGRATRGSRSSTTGHVAGGQEG